MEAFTARATSTCIHYLHSSSEKGRGTMLGIRSLNHVLFTSAGFLRACCFLGVGLRMGMSYVPTSLLCEDDLVIFSSGLLTGDSWRKGVAATGERVRGDSRVSKPKRDCRLTAPRSAVFGVDWPRVGFGILNSSSGLMKEGLVLGGLFTGVICSLIFNSPDSPCDGISVKYVLLGLVLAGLVQPLSLLALPLSLLALFSLLWVC